MARQGVYETIANGGVIWHSTSIGRFRLNGERERKLDYSSIYNNRINKLNLIGIHKIIEKTKLHFTSSSHLTT